MSQTALRALSALHARGLHIAVLAGIVLMPAVVAVGFWSDRPSAQPPLPALSDLRPSLPVEGSGAGDL